MVRIAAVCIAGLACAAPVAAGDVLPGPYSAQVVRVLDGDSIEARVTIWLGQQVTTTVRVAGIDTAELHAPCLTARLSAVAAKAFLQKRLDGKAIRLTDVETDKYGGRIVARVADEAGDDLATLLIGNGLARPYEGKTRPDWCR